MLVFIYAQKKALCGGAVCVTVHGKAWGQRQRQGIAM